MLILQKLASNWGDNNPKKTAWTVCKAALASTDKPGVVLKTVNAIKNCWQRVTLFLIEYMLNICAFTVILYSLKRNIISSRE
jgi:hypothetical protein